jgi:CHAD domain-containing protein/phosphohistidine phosphatase SixA
MAKKPTIESLCAKYKNEDVHSLHVARLALQLFDAVCAHVNLPPGQRPLLRAAALLHDIGYAQNPFDHPEEGAWIIVKKGIAGFSDEQCGTIAATILLHRKDYLKAFSFPLFRDLETRETALRLGALLRIADGLDHGHVQNTSILSVKQTPGGFLCTCASPGYHGSIAWATGKADLWKRVFSKEFRISEQSEPKQRPSDAPKYEGIVQPKDTVLDAARRLMYLQYRIITENHEGMLAAQDDNPLHDARVAIRRLRALLRLFLGFLPASSSTIDDGLANLAMLLSPLRDNDVWIRFLSGQRINRHFAGGIDFVHYCALESRMKKDDKRIVRGILKSEEYTGLMRAITRFLRVELPDTIRTMQALPLAPLASRKLLSIYYETLTRPGIKKEYDGEKMHAMRKLCRRGRYWSEFMAPLLGPPANLFAQHFKTLADTLGELHDADTALARISPVHNAVTSSLGRILRGSKTRIFSRFKTAWRAFRSNAMLYAATSLSHEADTAATRLYLVRHATAASDSERRRTLSSKGIQEAQVLARALSLLQCRPKSIASSRLVRSVHTAEFLAQAFSFSAPLVRKQCLMPGADVNDTLAWLTTMSGPSCVCVGHMPHLSQLAHVLMNPGQSDPIEFKKASACCILFGGEIKAGTGTLEWYYPQNRLRRIVDRITRKK